MIGMAVDMIGIVVGRMVVCGIEGADNSRLVELCRNVLFCEFYRGSP